jgi:hypothetical protein
MCARRKGKQDLDFLIRRQSLSDIPTHSHEVSLRMLTRRVLYIHGIAAKANSKPRDEHVC